MNWSSLAIIERANQIALGMAKTAYTVACQDITKAPAFNEALATQIGKDTLAQLKAEFGLNNVKLAADASGGELKIAQQAEGVAKVFIKAPSGRTIVGLAPVPV